MGRRSDESRVMDELFVIQGESGNYLQVAFREVYGFPESTCSWGGYELRSALEIKSGGFYVKSILFRSTGELYELYQQLLLCNKSLTGSASYITYENNLTMIAEYDNTGHVNISGRFAEQLGPDNALTFEFATDQTFIQQTLKQLSQIVSKYGGMAGIKR